MSERTRAKELVGISSLFPASSMHHAQVWAALTEPEHMKDGGRAADLHHDRHDTSGAGSFHMGMRSGEGYKMWGKFVYHDIVAPERLVFVNCFSNQAGEITRHPIGATGRGKR